MSTKKTAKPASKPKSAAKAKTAKKTAVAKAASNKESTQPLMVSTAAESASTRSRRNASSTITRSDRFRNIEDGMVPFKYSGGGVS